MVRKDCGSAHLLRTIEVLYFVCFKRKYNGAHADGAHGAQSADH